MEKPDYHGEVTCVLPHDNVIVLGVDIRRNPYGGRANVIDLTFWNSGIPLNTDVCSAGVFCPDDARSLASHLLNAASVIDQVEMEKRAGITGVRVLPTIMLCGTRFIIDERLRQLRNAENPAHFFDLDDRVWQ
jgi:hypothetical protein